jgi:hypothetical protein
MLVYIGDMCVVRSFNQFGNHEKYKRSIYNSSMKCEVQEQSPL